MMHICRREAGMLDTTWLKSGRAAAAAILQVGCLPGCHCIMAMNQEAQPMAIPEAIASLAESKL